MEIIDLINDCYLMKISTFSSYEYALIGGPWLLYDHYLTTRKWEPDFHLKDNEIEKVVAWTCPSRLPMNLYDRKFLIYLGNKVGRALEVDAMTSKQLRDKYARLLCRIGFNKTFTVKICYKR